MMRFAWMLGGALVVGCGAPAERPQGARAGGDSVAPGSQGAGDTALPGDSVLPDSIVAAAARPKDPPCIASRIGLPCADP